MNKVLFLNKPRGLTSFDVCYRLRKVFNTKSIGHSGTLDPNATGVMIILIDKATKLNQFLIHDQKTYQAKVRINIKTDTLDITGKVINTDDKPMPDREKIGEVLGSFMGRSMQIPPMTSAIKVNGRKLYDYQRKGQQVEVEARPIEIFDIHLDSIDDDSFSFTTTVSSGTYIRKLVEDIAERLGIIATLDDLTRLAVGEIGIDQCNSLEEVLNGNYYLTDPITLLRKRYFEVVVEDPKPYIDGKRVSIISDEDQVLITSGNEAIAIYERELGDTYRSKRGLF